MAQKIYLFLLTICYLARALAQSAFLYTGTLTLQIQGGQAGSTCNTNVRSFQQPAVLQFSAPVGQETNPLNMVMQTTGPATSDGGFAMFSATVVTPATLQYWQFQTNDVGTVGEGTMTQDHVAEAYALNTFVTNDPIIPYQCTGTTIPNLQAIAVGATMSYTVASDLSAAQVVVKGINTGQNYQFQADFQGARSG